MNVTGKMRLMKFEEKGKVLTATGYCFHNEGSKDEPKFETDFYNIRLVGQAKMNMQFLANQFDIEKIAIEVTSGLLRHKNYTNKQGVPGTYTDITIFDFTTSPKK